MSDPILHGRTVPPRSRPSHRPRARLVDHLQASVGRGADVVLVAAPAGSGKSVLLARWAAIRASLGPVAWLTLEEEDADPARCWSALHAALERAGLPGSPLAAVTDGSWLPGSAPPDPIRLGGALATALEPAADGATTLVLDDVHLVDGTPFHAALRATIAALPPGAVLALGSRVDPPLGLARLRAGGRLAEVRQADLAFTVDETADLLAAGLGVAGLRTDQVAALEHRTEGWVAGLQLAALSLAGRDPADADRFIAAFAGSHRHLVDYLVDEVVGRQPPELREALERTSVAERLSPGLVEALVDGADGRAVLDELERRQLFLVRLDDDGGWFRYHALFREGLRHLLARRSPGLTADLHRRAAVWLEAAGLPQDAVDHALAGDDPERAARLVRSLSATLVGRGEQATLEGWLARLPPEVVARHPGLGADLAALRLLRGDIEGSEALAMELTGALAADERPDAVWARGRVLGIAAAAAGSRMGWEAAIERGTRALELLPVDAAVDRCAVLAALARGWLDKGAPSTALPLLREGRRLGAESGNLFDRLVCEVLLARVALADGDAAGAEAGLREVLAATESLAIIPRFEAAVRLLEVLRTSGRIDEADGPLAIALDLGARLAGGRFVALARLEAARLAAARGDRPALARELELLDRSARLLGGERVLAVAAAEIERLGAGRAPADGDSGGSPGGGSPRGPLSARELEVLRLAAMGRSNRQIADELFVTVNTVKAHLHHISTKLDTANRTETVARARELGLLG